MSVIRLRNGRDVGNYGKPYIVAELNTSHFGNIDVAKEMVRRAKDAGCDCVKFQSWSAETLYCDEYYAVNAMAQRIFNKFALDETALRDLSLYSAGIGIDFASTPYSIEEAHFLVECCNVPFVKIASMELDNLPYLRELGKLGVPLMLSTGMGTSDEISRAVHSITSTGNSQIVILHCTSVYPSPPEIIRLENLGGLREKFPEYPVGYSDHSLGTEMSIAAVALGACMIEKHFTLDRKRIGMDNQMATEPAEMDALVAACNNVHIARGGPERILSETEMEQIPKMRRSMVSSRDLRAGSVLTADHVEFKRPGTGVSPAVHEKYLGKVVKVDLKKGSLITPEVFSAV